MSGRNSPCHGLASAAAFYAWIRAWQNHILAGQCHSLVHFIICKPDLALKQPLRLHLKPSYTQYVNTLITSCFRGSVYWIFNVVCKSS